MRYQLKEIVDGFRNLDETQRLHAAGAIAVSVIFVGGLVRWYILTLPV